MRFYIADVFTDTMLQGNGLTVVFPEAGLQDSLMLAITRELRQYETIFLFPEGLSLPSRIFTCDGELPFAGHPLLGAAAVIHHLEQGARAERVLNISLPDHVLPLCSRRTAAGFRVSMNQGRARVVSTADDQQLDRILSQLSIGRSELSPSCPPEVVSTGLSYLLLGITSDISEVRITGPLLEQALRECGADFLYFFDPQTCEGRTWDNLGRFEDAGTGSAAGPLCDYLVRHGFFGGEEQIIVHQGQYVSRPCTIYGRVLSDKTVEIQADVVITGEGTLDLSKSIH